MCGIAGFLNTARTQGTEELHAIAARMSGTLRHRGPDDFGVWTDAERGVALGHCRLSIIDLSPAGHQPMASRRGRFQLVYNGEIYNHAALRAELEPRGHKFTGHSDTEVMLAAILEWGLTDAVRRFIGMFAFALWDGREQTLTLARDRLGIKPLYYGRFGSTVLFGSELKALKSHPAFRTEIDRDALALFMQHNYIPAPHSIYQHVFKLPPGTLLTLRATDQSLPRPVPYWSLRDVVEHGKANPFTGSEIDAADELEKLLSDAVRLRMIADVPLGAFLSGGIDSSLVVALMQRHSTRPMKTFTIGFEEPSYNEAPFGKAVAEHLRTDHTEQYVSPREAMEVIPRLPELWDEPFADSSQIPTLLVSQLARRHVTVSLSGDGGDELFGGYQRYVHIDNLWRQLNRLPPPLRRVAAQVIEPCQSLIPSSLAAKIQRRIDRLKITHPGRMYFLHNIHWPEPERIVIGGRAVPTPASQPEWWPSVLSYREQWLYADTLTYLPDDILVKVDRASMAVGLEARVPLLDHRVVEFAWRLPLEWKIHGQTGKWLLRNVLERHVPPQLFERPKTGFGVPIDSWLRGPLRAWAEDLLDERRLRAEGYFHPEPIRQKWQAHLAGRENWHYHLWDILMFQAWLATQ